MSIFRRTDPFCVMPGSRAIVVAAPHAGTRPHSDSDLATGALARALADRLQARCVIVSDLRRSADVNKNPLTLSKAVRFYALRYQNEVFADLPVLVLEVHGHVTGKYAVEVSSGFELSPALPGDVAFLERLRRFKQTLPAQLAGIGLQVGVGVYPLDSDVAKAATNTYTFQKIHRARNQIGLEWYGLHIEMAADLRTGRRTKAPGYFDALAEAFASAITSAFDPLPDRDAVIPIHAPPLEQIVGGTQLRVARAADGQSQAIRAMLNARQASTLGFLEGDLISLYNRGQSLQLPVSASERVPFGQIALPARARGQLGLQPANLVVLARPGQPAAETAANNRPAFVIGGSRPGGQQQIWLCPSRLEGLQGTPGRSPRLLTPSAAAASVPVQLSPDTSVPERVAFVSQQLLRKLELATGDTIVMGTDT